MSRGRIAAFFDIDRTLIEVNSGREWLEYLRRRGEVGVWRTVRSLWWLGQYKLGLLDFENMAANVVRWYAGRSVAELEQEVEQWYAAEIADKICREARERVARHARDGHVTAILTSSTRFISDLLARDLDIPHVLCTVLEEKDGVLTGTHRSPACYGPGKVIAAERFANDQGIDLDASFFYTDSYTDVPMLERVGKPVVVNPDPRLRHRAIELGWGFETWSAQG